MTNRARKVHVLFLNAHGGLGADVAVHLSLARSFDRGQVRISAATGLREAPGASSRLAFEAIPDVTVLPLELGQPLGRQHGLGRAKALLDNLRGVVSLISLAAWCRKNKVDVVHVTERPRQALFGLLLARMSGCACLIHAHTSYQPHDASWLANWRLRQADAVVGVSKFTADSYQRLTHLPAGRVVAVHNAVDSDLFRIDTPDAARLAMRHRLGVPHDAPLIGCVARLMRWKGQATLLEAFALIRQVVPDARLVLAGVSSDSAPDGNGDYKDYLIRRIAALGLEDSVKLPGYIAESEMPELYAALDVLAHPAMEEPFGLAVVEAMAASRPVVAVDGGGIPEIIRDGVDGVLVPAEQPAALADAVTRLLREPRVAQRLAVSGRQRVVELFTPQRQAQAMLRVYHDVLTRRVGPSRNRVLTTRGSRTVAELSDLS